MAKQRMVSAWELLNAHRARPTILALHKQLEGLKAKPPTRLEFKCGKCQFIRRVACDGGPYAQEWTCPECGGRWSSFLTLILQPEDIKELYWRDRSRGPTAQRMINKAFRRMKLVRFTKDGDDRWEQVAAEIESRTYHKPPEYLVQRWARQRAMATTPVQQPVDTQRLMRLSS